jgi:hypothetical protein
LIDHFSYDLLWSLIEKSVGVRQASAVTIVAAHLIPFLLAASIVCFVYWIGTRRPQRAEKPKTIDINDPTVVPVRVAHFPSLDPVRLKPTVGRVARYVSTAFGRALKFLFYLVPGLNYEVAEPIPPTDRLLFYKMSSQAVFFAQRFAEAFPALRSPATFTDKHEIANRLGTLLAEPLSATNIDGFQQRFISPIWWTRGNHNLSIRRWCRIKPGVFLMNEHELEITRVRAIPGRAYWQNFIYMECEGQLSVGLRPIAPEDVASFAAEHAYCDEEFSIYNFRAYTISEDDDGGFVRAGRVRRFKHPRDRRVRYLTRVNFLIVQGSSPALALGVDDDLEARMNACLRNACAVDELTDWLLRLPKNPAADLAERV